jgi:aspartate/methionine/tyrosine aminotransferase
LVSGLNAIPGVSGQLAQGAIYAFPNVSSFVVPARELANHLLIEAGVAVLSGTDFGEFGEGYLRLCFATALEGIESALVRMAEFLNREF